MIYETIDMEVAIVSTRNHNRETFLSLPRITQHICINMERHYLGKGKEAKEGQEGGGRQEEELGED